MANSKINFAGLVKISGNQWNAYESAKTNGAGKIIFADITTEGHVGKYIYANGIEYKIADASDFDALVKRVEDVSQYSIDVSSALSTLNTHVTEVTDASVNALETWKPGVDASLINHETRIKDLEDASSAHGAAIADLSTYVHNTVDASINAIHTKDSEQDTSISDISTRLSNVAITAADNNIYVNGTSIGVEGDNYIDFTTAGNKASVAIKDSALAKGAGTGASDVSLATKGYVDEQVAVLEQALVFIGDISGTADASAKLTDVAVQAGYTYVATNSGEYNNKKFDAGDLIIVKTDAAAGSIADIIIVERNLDGAVTTGVTLSDDYVILGNGDQSVKVSTLTFSDLMTAIANANNALQTVTASTSTGDYVTIEAVKNASTTNVSVGVVTATLADASNGSIGLAMAGDVYTELAKVEEVMATSVTTMADTLGLDPSLGVTWSAQSGIDPTATYKEAIEGAYEEAHKAGVTSFGGATGEISVDNSATDGDVSFGMNSSTLVGKVSGWNTLVGRVADVSAHAEANDASIADLSTNVIPTINNSITSINSSISTLNSSVNALEQWANTTSFVNTITGDDYVKVDQSSGDVTLTTEVGDIPTATADASGLATAYDVSVFVNDQLAWAVISD